jgi:ATP-dependent DNA helicase RecQ
MIYMWGLVASGQAKGLNSHGKIQDISIFRPCYGNLGAKLMAIGVPILLMSATCRPQAIDQILVSLKITRNNITFVHGELSRPEITIWRLPMKHALSSGDDLLQLFGPEDCIADEDIPPTIVYSSTRHLTLQVLNVLNDARRKVGQLNPTSGFARRFHACTGDLDKEDVIRDFELGRFPVISSTMALGLGQNWSRVRRVVHIGRGDPATIFQMIGRCGRDGKPGLAILLVETSRRYGKNNISDFSNHEVQNDDDRMDGLAITPVCLRVAFSIDNK